MPLSRAVLILALTAAGAGSASPPLLAQDRPTARKLNKDEVGDALELVNMADLAMKGLTPSSKMRVSFESHIMRAPDGRSYVPFTVRVSGLEEMPALGIYVRVAARGDTKTSAERNPMGATGFAAGAVPVFAPGRAPALGAPHPGQASAALRLAEKGGPGSFPFEDFHFVDWEREPTTEAGTIRRALVVAPGSYDVYVAARTRRRASGTAPAAGAVKVPLEVPDLVRPGLAISDVIVADRVEPLERPVSQSEQVKRPYALGAFEIVPAEGRVFLPGLNPTFVFFVYNAGADAAGKPDVQIEYRFHREEAGQATLALYESQVFAEDTLPKEFDLRKQGVLIPTLDLSMGRFSPGRYHLEITVTDRVKVATAVQNFAFEVQGAR
jgi:hypothetical protein